MKSSKNVCIQKHNAQFSKTFVFKYKYHTFMLVINKTPKKFSLKYILNQCVDIFKNLLSSDFTGYSHFTLPYYKQCSFFLTLILYRVKSSHICITLLKIKKNISLINWTLPLLVEAEKFIHAFAWGLPPLSMERSLFSSLQ